MRGRLFVSHENLISRVLCIASFCNNNLFFWSIWKIIYMFRVNMISFGTSLWCGAIKHYATMCVHIDSLLLIIKLRKQLIYTVHTPHIVYMQFAIVQFFLTHFVPINAFCTHMSRRRHLLGRIFFVLISTLRRARI